MDNNTVHLNRLSRIQRKTINFGIFFFILSNLFRRTAQLNDKVEKNIEMIFLHERCYSSNNKQTNKQTINNQKTK